MQVHLNKAYIDNKGYQIIPIELLNEDIYICLLGYNVDVLSNNYMTRATINISDIKNGNYSSVLEFYTEQQLSDYKIENEIENDEFVPFLSLENLTIYNTNLEIGKSYYNEKDNYIYNIIGKYKENFYYYVYNYLPFLISTLEPINAVGFSISPTWFGFITDFNNTDNWIEVPKFYWDIASGTYGCEVKDVENALKIYKRKIFLNKIL